MSLLGSRVSQGGGFSNGKPLDGILASRMAGDTVSEPPKKKAALFQVGPWQDTPDLEDQLKRYPHTTRLGAVQVQTFQLPAEQETLNKLLASAHPPGAPCTKIVSRERHFNPQTGGFSYLVEFVKISYQKIIQPTSGLKPEEPDTN